uniref:Uncharacterized protein n=1 Tax=Naja naja TaxID=35670 RepID=A0A8C6Y5F6_NAJNA
VNLNCIYYSKTVRYILVRMLSEAGTGCSFNVKRLRLQDKLVMLHYDRLRRVFSIGKKISVLP